MSVDNAMNELADLMAQACLFAECDFRLWLEEGQIVLSPPRKKALASWTIYYNSTINPSAQVVNNLMPLLEQCEVIDAENLKASKLHLVRRMLSLKSDFDAHFEHLLEKLSSLMGEILLKCLGDNLKKE